MNKFLKLGLIASPFIHILFLKEKIGHIAALYTICFIFITMLLWLSKISKTRFNYFWLWCFISSVFIYGKSIGNLFYLLHVSLFFIVYYALVTSDVDWKCITKPLGAIAVIISLFSIFEILGIRQFHYRWFANPGLLFNPTNSAMYIAVTMPFLLLYKRGLLYSIIPLTAALMLKSTSALLGILSIIIIISLVKKRYTYLVAAVSTIVLLSIFKHDYFIGLLDSSGKLYIWNMAIQDWMKSAWIGFGLSASEAKYTYLGITWRYLHNEVIYILHALGLIGLTLFGIFVAPIIKNAIKNRNELYIPIASFVSVVVMSLFSIPLRVYPITLITAFNLAILTRSYKNDAY